MRTLWLIPALTLLLVAEHLPAGWGSGGCSPTGPVGPYVRRPMSQLPPTYQPGTSGCCSAQCTCGCNRGGGCPCVGKPAPQAKPAAVSPLPDPFAAEAQEVLNFGVDMSRVGQTGSHYRINDQSVTWAEAKDAVGGGQLKDDSTKLRLTVIGPEAARTAVVHDLMSSPSLAPFLGQIAVKDYAPDHWAVSRTGFKTDGQPTIYLQAPDGKVLHRQDDYQGGPEKLAEALRKADPNYKPASDPDKRQAPLLPSLPALPSWPPWAWIMGATAALMLFGPKPEGN